MKNKTIQKFSPLALGVMVFSYPLIQGSIAYGASLKSAAADSQLLKPGVPELQSTSGSAVGCSLSPAGSGLGLPSVTGSTGPVSNVVASSVAGSVVPAAEVAANAPALDNAAPLGAQESAAGNLVAQASIDDCCEIGGTTTCEVGGLPPAGGGVLGGGPSPLLALLGVPAALIPAFLGDGNGSSNNPTPTPVPESSSTGVIAAGFGLVGLWYGRRLRNARKTYS